MTEREQALIENIKKQSEAGFSKDEIRNNLIKEEYTPEEFEKYIRKISSHTSYQKQSIKYTLLIVSLISALLAFKKYNEVLNFEKLSPIVIFLGFVSIISFISFIIYSQKM